MVDLDGAKRFVGIDLGTTYSAVAWLDPHGTPVTLPNAEGEISTPSVVLFDPSGEVVVGREAKRAALVLPESVAEGVKRDMGQAQYHGRINKRFFSPTNISALILKKLKQDAEIRIGPIVGAVLTVPAYFNEAQRRATAAAGEIAGLKIIDILNEPTAAALAYAFRDFVARGGRPDDALTPHHDAGPPRTVVVYDLGGGTFDVTVLRISGDDLTVLATAGDAELGGRDWDECIVRWAAEEFKRKWSTDPTSDVLSHQALVLTAEEAKKDLSRLSHTRLAISHAGAMMRLELTRTQFEAMTADLLRRTRERLSRVIIDAGLNWSGIDELLAVGGSSRMPMVLRTLREVTGREPNCTLPPGEAVAHGAAIHAAIKAVDLWAQRTRVRASPSSGVLQPPEPWSPPSEEPAGKSEPHADTVADIDVFAHLNTATAGAMLADDPATGAGDASAAIAAQDNIDPDDQWDQPPQDAPLGEKARDELLQNALADEVIDLEIGEDPVEQFDPSIGQTLRRIHKTDVNSHSLGVVVTHAPGKRANSILIPRNSPLPVSVTKRFGTVRDSQPEVVVHVLEGESRQIEECALLGICRIRPLPPGLAQNSPVDVTFRFDSSGRLKVQAMEVTSGKSVVTTIHCDGGVTEERIQRATEAVRQISVI